MQVRCHKDIPSTSSVSSTKASSQETSESPISRQDKRDPVGETGQNKSAAHKDDEDSDEDEFHDCISWGEGDLEVGIDVGAMAEPEKPNFTCTNDTKSETSEKMKFSTNSLPKMMKDSENRKTKWLNRQLPPFKKAPDGTTVHYWCDMPSRRASFSGRSYGMLLHGVVTIAWIVV